MKCVLPWSTFTKIGNFRISNEGLLRRAITDNKWNKRLVVLLILWKRGECVMMSPCCVTEKGSQHSLGWYHQAYDTWPGFWRALPTTSVCGHQNSDPYIQLLTTVCLGWWWLICLSFAKNTFAFAKKATCKCTYGIGLECGQHDWESESRYQTPQ